MLQLILGKYRWQSYDEVDQVIDHLGSSLAALGQQPRATIALFCETRAEWMVTAQACFRRNFPCECRPRRYDTGVMRGSQAAER